MVQVVKESKRTGSSMTLPPHLLDLSPELRLSSGKRKSSNGRSGDAAPISAGACRAGEEVSYGARTPAANAATRLWHSVGETGKEGLTSGEASPVRTTERQGEDERGKGSGFRQVLPKGMHE
jgi:hypothetical protein